jgi:hypothetical protein
MALERAMMDLSGSDFSRPPRRSLSYERFMKQALYLLVELSNSGQKKLHPVTARRTRRAQFR